MVVVSDGPEDEAAAAVCEEDLIGSKPFGAVYHLGAFPSAPPPRAQQFFFRCPVRLQLSHTTPPVPRDDTAKAFELCVQEIEKRLNPTDQQEIRANRCIMM